MIFHRNTDRLAEVTENARRRAAGMGKGWEVIVTISKSSPRARSSYYGFHFAKEGENEVGQVNHLEDGSVEQVEAVLTNVTGPKAVGTDSRGYTLVACEKGQFPSEDVHRNEDVYVSRSYIGQDYKTAAVVYFVSADNGDEYGQFATEAQAVAQADKAGALRKEHGAANVSWVGNYSIIVTGELVATADGGHEMTFIQPVDEDERLTAALSRVDELKAVEAKYLALVKAVTAAKVQARTLAENNRALYQIYTEDGASSSAANCYGKLRAYLSTEVALDNILTKHS